MDQVIPRKNHQTARHHYEEILHLASQDFSLNPTSGRVMGLAHHDFTILHILALQDLTVVETILPMAVKLLDDLLNHQQ
jgi:hypothetical protein